MSTIIVVEGDAKYTKMPKGEDTRVFVSYQYNQGVMITLEELH